MDSTLTTAFVRDIEENPFEKGFSSNSFPKTSR